MERELHMLGQHKHDSKEKDNLTEWNAEKVEDRMYVLRHIGVGKRNGAGQRRYEYYTGRVPTKRIHEAKTFTLSKAKSTKQFAATAHACEIKRVTQKMLFKAALQGI
jgi:hypothetical protein